MAPNAQDQADRVAALQQQLEEERTHSGQLQRRLHETESKVTATTLRLDQREGYLQSLIRAGDRMLEVERREVGNLRSRVAELERALTDKLAAALSEHEATVPTGGGLESAAEVITRMVEQGRLPESCLPKTGGGP